MSETTRPEWASGEEWEGWREHDLGGPVYRSLNGRSVLITKRGQIVICGSSIQCLSPAHALNAANALAEAAGGWA